MKFLFLALLSFSAYANHGDASCVVGNHRSQRFSETAFTADEACQRAKLTCEQQTGMVCFEIDREEGFGGGYDDYGYDDGGFDYDDGDFDYGRGDYDDGGYDDWDVINGRRVNKVVCKVPIFTRGGRSVIRKQGRTPQQACQKALRACRSQIGPMGSCGRPQVERNYRR
jgi:hypothetical protein